MSSRLPADPAPDDAFLTAAEAARLLRLHVKHVQRLAAAGRLPAHRLGRRWLFRRADLLARASGTATPTPERLTLSARNQLPARIERLVLDRVVAEVHLRVGDVPLVAMISRTSAERLGLAVGQEVLAVVKATEVMIGRR